MRHGVAWLVTGCLLALWSLGLWALHAVAQWGAGIAGATASVAGNGAAAVARQVEALRPPGWLSAWLPTGAEEQWGAMVSTFTPWGESALIHAPSLVAWLAPAIWVVWALGGVLLLVVGGGLSALILVINRHRSSPAMA